MKISVLEVFIAFLFFIDPALFENIEIDRGQSDSFYIPPSICHQQDGGFGNNCNDVCNTEETVNDNRYSCSCREKNAATLTYRNNLWGCLRNRDAREYLGCQTNNIFDGEGKEQPLQVLRISEKRRTKLGQQDCGIFPGTSWYIGCNGERKALTAYTTSFELRWEGKRYVLTVKNDSYQGHIINLGMRCTSRRRNNSCLLFKVQGQVSCPIAKPGIDGFSSTTAVIATSSVIHKSSYPNLPTEPTSTPSKGQSQPGSGVRQTADEDTSSSSSSVIIGVTVSIITVLLLIAAVVICRRYKSRKDDQTSTTHQRQKKILGWILPKNVALKHGAENVNADRNNSEKGISQPGDWYASLEIPEGDHIYGHGDVKEPDYAVLQGRYPNNGEESLYYGFTNVDQPQDKALEAPRVKIVSGADNEGTNTVAPVYSEGPYPDSSESHGRYGTRSVNEPFYNTLKESYPNSGFEDNNDEAIYNTLEEPYVTGADEEGSYGPTTLQEPVYNVLQRVAAQK